MIQRVMHNPNTVQRIYRFYIDGFRRMTVGKSLWKIIFIKLFKTSYILAEGFIIFLSGFSWHAFYYRSTTGRVCAQ